MWLLIILSQCLSKAEIHLPIAIGMSSRGGYSQVHHSGTARHNHGVDGDDGEFGSVEEDGDEDAGRPPTKHRRVFIWTWILFRLSLTWSDAMGVVIPRKSQITNPNPNPNPKPNTNPNHNPNPNPNHNPPNKLCRFLQPEEFPLRFYISEECYAGVLIGSVVREPYDGRVSVL